MATLAIIIGICLTVIAMIDGLVAFWNSVPRGSFIGRYLSADMKIRLSVIADYIRDIDSDWDDVNQIIFGTGLILIGLGLLMSGLIFGIIFVFFGAFKVM